MENVRAILTAKPKRRINMVRWMLKHSVGTNVISSDYGIPLAIERQYNND